MEETRYIFNLTGIQIYWILAVILVILMYIAFRDTTPKSKKSHR